MAELNGDLVPNVKKALDAIIASEKMTSPVSIDVSPGSQLGDGFASKTYAIIIKGNEKTINLFVKYLPESTNKEIVDLFTAIFYTELRFYEDIYPEMEKFQQDKNLREEDNFDHVPKYYGNGIKYVGIPPIVLENLRISGYTLRDFKEPIDDPHITLALKAFAKYHALSYAMKDQKPDLFKQISKNIQDPFVLAFNTLGLSDSLGTMMDGFVCNLHPITDRTLLNACGNLREILIGHATTVEKHIDDYAVICQGDCWSNNMMFQYDETSGNPINIKLIDWQIQRYNSPILDVAYFFYTVATKDVLSNFDKYLKLYYDTLAGQIKKLGSDPTKTYPRLVFLNHWKKFAKFGLTMSFGSIMAQQMKKEDLPNFIENGDKVPMMPTNIDGKSNYDAQMKLLVEHFVERDFL